MLLSTLVEKLQNGDFNATLTKLYPNKDASNRAERIIKLAKEFEAVYGDRDVSVFSAPGRTELSGNHTDHNNGLALAAPVDIDIIAIASKTDDNIVKVKSEGYPENIVDVTAPTPESAKEGSSSAIISGIADYLMQKGFKSGGFVAFSTSDVLTGSGLSSSAAFEVLCARIFSEFYNDGKVPSIELAKAGKFAENVYFGKPCGLLDQAACATGGCVWLDFENGVEPVIEQVDFDLSKFGYCLCIVNTGGNHADLTDDYAAVPSEMHSIAALMGKKTLRECDEADFTGRISYLRSIVGDRAIMRAMHYFAENKRVDALKDAIKNDDFDTYLSLVSASGNSSFKFLQNVYTTKNVQEQGISLALALTEKFGATCRVHGGGFAGTIQAYIKKEQVAEYKAMIESVFGENTCNVNTIRPFGAVVVEENNIKG